MMKMLMSVAASVVLATASICVAEVKTETSTEKSVDPGDGTVQTKKSVETQHDGADGSTTVKSKEKETTGMPGEVEVHKKTETKTVE